MKQIVDIVGALRHFTFWKISPPLISATVWV